MFLVLFELLAAFDIVDHNFLLSLFGNKCRLLLFSSGTSTRLSNSLLCVKVNIQSELSNLAYRILQGFVLGLILFCMYTLPFDTIIFHHGLYHHTYVDDTHIMCTSDFKSPQVNLIGVRPCFSNILTWMINNKLKMNNSKTEFLLVRLQSTA